MCLSVLKIIEPYPLFPPSHVEKFTLSFPKHLTREFYELICCSYSVSVGLLFFLAPQSSRMEALIILFYWQGLFWFLFSGNSYGLTLRMLLVKEAWAGRTCNLSPFFLCLSGVWVYWDFCRSPFSIVQKLQASFIPDAGLIRHCSLCDPGFYFLLLV